MKRLILFFISIFFLGSTCDAALYKGQREFVKRCTKCHKHGQAFIATKTQKDWKGYMKNSGEKLAEIHLALPDNAEEKLHEYFSGETFSRNSTHLKQFLVEYAKDSGNVPACD